MADQWYYQLFGQEYGPVPFGVVADKFSSGELGIRDLVRQGSSGAWVKASTVKALTDPGSQVAVETIDVATDIDSFLLVDEKHVPEPEVASDIDSFLLIEEKAAEPELATDLDSFQLIDDDSASLLKPATASRASAYETYESAPVARSSGRGTATPSRGGSSSEWDDLEPTPLEPAAHTPVVAVPAQVVTDAQWYCYINDQEYGPMSMADLQNAVAQGQVVENGYVKYGAAGEWVLAGQVPNLFAVTPPVAAPVMPAAPAPLAAALAAPVGNLADAERSELVTQLLTLLKQGLSAELLGGGQPLAPVVGTGWFCNISGSIIGPVSIESLVQMVLQKRLFPDDLIRMGSTGEWFPAKTVPDLFPDTAAQGKGKKANLDSGESVMDRIDRMYREGQEAQAKLDAAKAAAPQTEVKSAQPKVNPAGDMLRNMNANIARGNTAAAKKAAKASSDSLGDQFSQLFGGLKFDGKMIGILAVLVLVGAGYFVVPMVMAGIATKSALSSLVALHGDVVKAKDSASPPPKAKDWLKQIDTISKTVKNGASGSAQRDVSRMGRALRDMVDALSKPAAVPVAEGSLSEFDRASKSYADYLKAAKKKLGMK